MNANVSLAALSAALACAASACAHDPGTEDAGRDLPAPVIVRNTTNATLTVELREEETGRPVSAPGEVGPCGRVVLAFSSAPRGNVRVHGRADRVENGSVYGFSWPKSQSDIKAIAVGAGGWIELTPGDFGSYLLFDGPREDFDLSKLCSRRREE